MKTQDWTKEQVIWDGWEIFNKESMNDWKKHMFTDEDDICRESEYTEDEIFQMWCEEINEYWLEDERINLDYRIAGEIVCVADVGLWNRRVSGARVVGDRISDIMQSEMNCISYCKWYGQNYDIWGRESHHDGNNEYLYRVIPAEYDAEEVCRRFRDGEISKDTFYRKYTRSLYPYVAHVYGWKHRALPKDFRLYDRDHKCIFRNKVA